MEIRLLKEQLIFRGDACPCSSISECYVSFFLSSKNVRHDDTGLLFRCLMEENHSDKPWLKKAPRRYFKCVLQHRHSSRQLENIARGTFFQQALRRPRTPCSLQLHTEPSALHSECKCTWLFYFIFSSVSFKGVVGNAGQHQHRDAFQAGMTAGLRLCSCQQPAMISLADAPLAVRTVWHIFNEVRTQYH